ncbi:Malonyl CoA-acyl carrier protein transacylase [Streptomyces zhaozhouensis]|uniref:[acyl-carrier-protein] S-malonyltransferase n=1 Tax=Streptomyces zhaozhouensis TaxID=1300267 RepID=A0A286E0S1_9ACTN|nr:acyltransferase domain-containing protein [Streptomyces zhaozhouensis]SOD64501.1 Malonyl CoA-acyl carrier protein transacylase [Streptomyces zhaozhouensis]
MSVAHTTLLFPGQGAWAPGLLARLADRSAVVDEVVGAVAPVAKEELGVDLTALSTDRTSDVQTLLETSPELLQVAIFTASVASARALREDGVVARLHIGHSFGEIAALTAAGVCSVEDGARIVARRVRALDALAGAEGVMLAVRTSRERAEGLLAFLDDASVTMAGVNAERQVVLSGGTESMLLAREVLRQADVPAVRLDSPHPFHSPLLRGAAEEFAAALGDIAWHTPEVPVHSPILGRRYAEGDDFAALLASHLVTPFDFPEALRTARAEGTELFVECGGRQVLTDLVGRVLEEESGWTAVAVDESGRRGTSLDDVARLADGGEARLRAAVRHLLGDDATEFDRFWREEGIAALRAIRRSYDRFTGRESVPEAPAAPGEEPAAPAVRPAPPVEEPAAAAEPAPVRAVPAPAPAPARALDRATVLAELAELYGAALEYPTEVFTEDVMLEADLGVDSVKQTDLLGRVAKQYQLPPQPEEFNISDYATFGRVADMVLHAEPEATAAAA